jgi:hypothetical protein
MDCVLESGQLKPREVCMLNHCPLFLGVTTISNVATVDGKDIDRTMFLGTPSLLASQTKWTQAEQVKRYAASWVMWRRALRLWSDWHGHLHQPLAQWLLPGPFLGRNWNSYLTKRTKQLILAKQEVYKIYHRKRHRKYPVTPHGTVPSHPPSDAYPVSIEFHHLRSIKVKISPGLFPDFAASPPRTFMGYLIATLEQWK